MKDLALVYEMVPVSTEDQEMRLDKAFDILFSKIAKAANVGSQNPQIYIRATEVSINA